MSLAPAALRASHVGGRRGYTQSTTELATGLRYRVGRLALDAGVRHMAGTQSIGEEDIQRNSALLATHWSF